MFTLAILLCSPMQCMSATTPQPFATEDDCRNAAIIIKQQGLTLIDRGEIAPHTFNYQCIVWGNTL